MYMVTEQNSSMNDILDAREARAAMQDHILAQYKNVLITVTMNIPGPIKSAEWITQCFTHGIKDFSAYMKPVCLQKITDRQTAAGPEAFFVVMDETDAACIKKQTVLFEDQYPVGRWFDIDVRDMDGRYLSRSDTGLPGRICFLCGKDAKSCARSRTHTTDELFAYTRQKILQYLEEIGDTGNC